MERKLTVHSLPLRLSLVATLVALCVIGSFIKIPSLTGTVALDSLPGFFGAIALGYIEGALIAFLGHILTSFNVGFPLGIPVHFLIALEMAGIVLVFRFAYMRWRYPGAILAGVILNGVLAPLSITLFFGWGFFLGMLPPLAIGSLVNVALAVILHRVLIRR